MLGVTLSFVGCADEAEEGGTPPREPFSLRAGEVDEATGRELVHESIRNVAEDGSSVLISASGFVTPEIEQATARPWTHLGDQFTYNDESWSVPLDDGTIEIGFRIWRTPNEAPYEPPEEWGPPLVDANVMHVVDESPEIGPLFLDLRLRNFPEWDLPLLGSAHTMAAEDYAALVDQREVMMTDRAELLDEMSAELRAAIEELGGTVEGTSPSGGWISVSVPATALDLLAARNDLAVISNANGEVTTQVGPPYWRQGESGLSERTDGQSLSMQGYDGAQANPGRHGFGRIVIAVIEEYPFEDDACAFMDSANCSNSRILGRYACDDSNGDLNYCEFVSNWDDENEPGDPVLGLSHGTISAAAALGDYADDQGCGRALNDPDWGGVCHSDDWERWASGMAPEAFLLYYGKWKAGFKFTSIAASIDKAAFQNADIINMSLGVGGDSCNAEAINIVETAAENAFDDGALVVAAAGNYSGPTSLCNTISQLI